MSDHPVHQAYAAAFEAALNGEASVIPLGRDVLCDVDSTDLTDDPRSGGFMFDGFGGTHAAGPCCAAKTEARLRAGGEEKSIRSRCPEGVPFADWVRDMRGPEAAIRVTPGGAR